MTSSRARMARSLLVVLLPAMGSWGCLSARPAVWEHTRPVLETMPMTGGERRDMEKLLPAMEAAWQERADPARLREALGLLDKVLAIQPTAERYVLLSRGWHFLAEGELALAGAPEAERKAAYEKALKAAELGLAMGNGAFVKRVRGGGAFIPAMALLEPESAPALYWYAVNLARWSDLGGPLKVYRNRDRVVAAMKRVLDLDADYHHAGAHRYLGAYFAVSMPLAGRSLEKARHHFHESLSRSPQAFATKVLMAQHLAVKQGDRDLFERLLKDVLAADPAVIPDLAPEQALEKLKAEVLLKRAGSLF